MFWFHSSVTLILLLALGLGLMGLPRRQMIEAATLLVTGLPLLSWALEFLIPVQFKASWPWMVSNNESFFSLPLTELWVAGGVLQAILMVRKWIRLGRLKAASSDLADESIALIASCIGQPENAVRRHFRMSSSIQTPLVLPGICGVVLLQRGWDSWPMRLRSGALRHEWHHLQRRDAQWNVWMHAFRAIFWFHPLAWLAVETWTDACENEADLAAVNGRDPADYAQDLLGIATLQPSGMAGAVCFLGSSKLGLQRRIQSLLSTQHGPESQRPLWLKMTGPLLIIGIALICALLGIRKQTVDLQEASLRLAADAFPADH